MRKSRFTEGQIVGILKEAEAGVDVASLLCKYGIARTTFYKWRSQYAGTSELRTLRPAYAPANICDVHPGMTSHVEWVNLALRMEPHRYSTLANAVISLAWSPGEQANMP